jgi:hypothetical protein
MSDIQINPHEIYHRAKGQWLRTEAPKRDMQDLFFDLRILLLMLALIAMGLLSSSHTVEAFSHNAPFALAMVSPLAFELYLLASTLTGRGVPRDWGTRLTQVLIFVVAVIANGASGWQQATSTSGANMLIIYQSMALIAAPIVPLATMSIGHQLVISIQTRQTTDKVTDAWLLAEYGVFYKALYTAYNTQGIQPSEARKLAQADVRGYLDSGAKSVKVTNEQPRLVAQVADNSRPITDTGSVADTADNSGLTGQPRLRKGEAKQRFEALIQSDPAYLDNPLLSVDTLADRLGVGRSTAGEMLKQWRGNQHRELESVV